YRIVNRPKPEPGLDEVTGLRLGNQGVHTGAEELGWRGHVIVFESRLERGLLVLCDPQSRDVARGHGRLIVSGLDCQGFPELPGFRLGSVLPFLLRRSWMYSWYLSCPKISRSVARNRNP